MDTYNIYNNLAKIYTNKILIFIIIYGLLDYKIEKPIISLIITSLVIFIFYKSKMFCLLEPFINKSIKYHNG